VWLSAFLVLSAACERVVSTPTTGPVAEAAQAGVPMGATRQEEAGSFLPSGRGGTLVVQTRRWRFLIYDEPGAGAVLTHRLWADNPWGQPLAYEVVGTARDQAGDGWFRVRLPVRPNGSTGWVRAADVVAHRVHERIVIDLSAHVLRRYRRGTMRSRIEVAAGAPTTPTAPGSYFVWAQVSYDDPSGPYGAYALGLSGFSRVLTEWPGGGRLAIHGTADPSDIGRDVSHGCVRVYNPDLLRALQGVPLGTPVLIRP
jgi:hypothetical protein